MVQCTGGNSQRCRHYVRVQLLHQSLTFLSHISLLGAPATTTSFAVPWCTTAWCSSRLPVTAVLGVYPAFSCTVLRLNPKLLVSQGSAPTAYSCISTLRCRATVVSSERLCFKIARCWNPLKLARWSVNALVVLGPPVDFLSIHTLRVYTHQKGVLLTTVRFRCAV